MENKIQYVHDDTTHNIKDGLEVLPYILDMFDVKSIIDIGCGNGSWLQAAENLGINDIKGIDGVDILEKDLLIKKSNFDVIDLTKPFDVESKYDLAICLEVAEHLDKNSSQTIIDTICKHSNLVLFSAAIPNQGGQNHLNEQWPDYWQQRFAKNGYKAYDMLRDKFWTNENVFWWYRQNMLIFSNYKDLNVRIKESEVIRKLVHPHLFNRSMPKLEFQERKELLKSLKKTIKLLIKS